MRTASRRARVGECAWKTRNSAREPRAHAHQGRRETECVPMAWSTCGSPSRSAACSVDARITDSAR